MISHKSHRKGIQSRGNSRCTDSKLAVNVSHYTTVKVIVISVLSEGETPEK